MKPLEWIVFILLVTTPAWGADDAPPPVPPELLELLGEMAEEDELDIALAQADMADTKKEEDRE